MTMPQSETLRSIPLPRISPRHVIAPSASPTRDRRKKLLYLLPFFLILFVSTLSSSKSDLETLATSALVDSDPSRIAIFGSIYALALVLVLTRIRPAFDLLASHWPYPLLLVYVLASATWSAYPYKVFLAWGHFVGTTLVCLAAVTAVRGKEEKLLLGVIVGYAAIAIGISLLTVFLLPSRGILEIGGKLRWVGLTPTPNILGVIALISVWASTALLALSKTTRTRALLAILIALSGICLYGSNSVTSTVLALFVVFSVASLLYIEGKSTAHRTLAIVGVAIIALMATLIGYLIAPESLATETFLRLIGRSSTLTGRSELWEIAVSAISEKPLLGWSFDSLMSLKKYRMQYGQFHNGYLDLLVRGGWLALLFVLVFLAMMVKRLFRLARANYRLFVILAALLIVIVLHNVTEASLARPPHPTWLMFTLLFFYLNRHTIAASRASSVDRSRAKIINA